MCGIVGIVTNQRLEKKDVQVMCEAMIHRGPDDAGIKIWPEQGVGLGHRRLAIIDLSPAGQNPMCNEDGRIWITFNGEIYNFQTLRRELIDRGHSFRSQTDTEVIIHAYEEWGDEHVHRLRGMFAYTIYDQRGGKTRLLLVRDRLGIKPLHYTQQKNSLLFASELKAILKHPTVQPTISRSAIFDFLTYRYIPTPKTAYNDIYKLPPGHWLVYEDGRVSTHQYWDIDLNQTNSMHNVEEAIEMVQATLEEVVSLHLISDVPLGVFLSGGLDSSSITAVTAAQLDKPVCTFSVGFDVQTHDETAYARLVADYFQTDHHEQTVTIGSMREMLPYIVEMYDEPFADGSSLPTYMVSKAARQWATVAISGDGGDELFWGYNWFESWLQRQPQASRTVPAGLRQRLAEHAHKLPRKLRNRVDYWGMEPVERYGLMQSLFTRLEKRTIVSLDWLKEFADYDDYWYFRQYWQAQSDPITQAQYLDLKTFLPDDILTKVDRASMAVSLEVRPPLLDHLLVEQVMRLPPHLRVPQQQKKQLLKLAMSDRLPPQILQRNKKGFSAPFTSWLRLDRDWVESYLSDGEAVRQGILTPQLLDTLKYHTGGERLWGLLLLETWLQQL